MRFQVSKKSSENHNMNMEFDLLDNRVSCSLKTSLKCFAQYIVLLTHSVHKFITC